MAAPPRAARAWRPAPFPVHEPDRRRTWLEHALLLCCLLVFASALLPRRAGNEGTLLLPVDYHCVELEQRSPAIIMLRLPKGEYTVDPESLGYFTAPGEFVYTAVVPRGLIYGRAGGRLTVLEVAAPQDSQAFIQFHLDQIRASVVEQNRLENMLAAARATALDAPGKLDQDVERQYDKLGAKASSPTTAQALAVARRAGADADAVAASLERLSRRRVELKQRYYACQRARLDVLGQEAALQLALASLPNPRFNELLSLGNAETVRGTVLADLARLESAWQERLRVIRQELAQASSGATGDASDPQADSTVAGSVMPPPDAPAGEPEGVVLIRALSAARMEELHGEEGELERSLMELARVRTQSVGSQPPAWTDLPRLEFKPQQLARPSLVSMPGFSQVLALDGAAAPTMRLLQQLACRFEGWPAIEVAGQVEQVELVDAGHPFELPYGLLAVDLALRRQARASQRAPGVVVDEQAIGSGLRLMLEYPDSYGLAQLDLAYLRCLAWYAREAEAGLAGSQAERKSVAKSLAGAVKTR